MIGGRRPITGRKPGDKRIRVERHHAPYFRYTGPGQLTAKAAPAPDAMGQLFRVKPCSGRPRQREEAGNGCRRRALVFQLGRDLVVA
jgi:hypothetical protein